MNKLYDYDGFDEDIKEAFAGIITKYNFQFEFTRSNDVARGYINNKRCFIEVGYGLGETFCRVNNQESSCVDYEVSRVYNFLNSKNKKYAIFNYAGDWPSPLETLKTYASLLMKMENILLGDFSWIADYNKMYKIYEYAPKPNAIQRLFSKVEQRWESFLKSDR